MKSAKRGRSSLPEAECKLTEAEVSTVKHWLAMKKGRKPGVGLRVKVEHGASNVSYDHEDGETAAFLLAAGVAAQERYFFPGLLSQIINASSKGGEADEQGLNFMMSVIRGIDPRDQVESMLAAQMAAAQMASMGCARKLMNAEYQEQRESAERSFNRLCRTYTAQMEALKRYRSKGQQTVRVERVTVNDGGQAIVGPVNKGGGDSGEN